MLVYFVKRRCVLLESPSRHAGAFGTRQAIEQMREGKGWKGERRWQQPQWEEGNKGKEKEATSWDMGVGLSTVTEVSWQDAMKSNMLGALNFLGLVCLNRDWPPSASGMEVT